MLLKIKNNQGFSFIELLVTLTVFSFFALLVFGGFNYYIGIVKRVKGESETIYALQQATEYLVREMKNPVRVKKQEGPPDFGYNLFSHPTDSGNEWVLKYSTLIDRIENDFRAHAVFVEDGVLRTRQCINTTEEANPLAGSDCINGGTWDLTPSNIEVTNFRWQVSSYLGDDHSLIRFTLSAKPRDVNIAPITIQSTVAPRNYDGIFTEALYEI
ncbi:MAG: hypothetical protein COT81_03800 [Candidatus Buchananbacteria bacterium CG10_big_fil_rev_8_21_14_0_10_42_9]|uniref:Type II secretion system protein J n=1 Tax=Candidatus Buchananbacteria bacterium CG10_big_fil_rev_8_21_14_0_10_42_9 TaxID=1974526 RepID=A0A2H0W2V2_9BACT|nr:MAG: hypothetical protein COT81_03800 [Candidatus Buchananbacteria bacterium CG10_big_fil_rev_8_21_14_0_10_42_9]